MQQLIEALGAVDDRVYGLAAALIGLIGSLVKVLPGSGDLARSHGARFSRAQSARAHERDQEFWLPFAAELYALDAELSASGDWSRMEAWRTEYRRAAGNILTLFTGRHDRVLAERPIDASGQNLEIARKIIAWKDDLRETGRAILLPSRIARRIGLLDAFLRSSLADTDELILEWRWRLRSSCKGEGLRIAQLKIDIKKSYWKIVLSMMFDPRYIFSAAWLYINFYAWIFVFILTLGRVTLQTSIAACPITESAFFLENVSRHLRALEDDVRALLAD